MIDSAGDNAPFFIVGCGRSGTTLLRLVLSGHSRIEIPPETWFLLALVAHLPLTDPLTPAQVEAAIALITGDYRWPDMQMTAADFAARAR
ncbi:MAG: sulfotransferase, partial [Acetobacteraceae bacterium]